MTKIMNILKVAGMPITVFLLISACSTIEVSENYDTTYDFSKLKTYNWIPVESKKYALIVKQLQRELKKQLAVKGFVYDETNPDFQIALYGGTEDKVSIHTTYSGYQYGNWYRGRRGGYYAGSPIDVYEYEEGTLILDFIDGKSKEMVFRSVTTKEITRKPTAEKRQKNIENVIAKAIKSFPPKVNTK